MCSHFLLHMLFEGKTSDAEIVYNYIQKMHMKLLLNFNSIF